MNQTFNDLRLEFFLNRGQPAHSATEPRATFRPVNHDDPRATALPVADGFVWLVKLWWKQWSERRTQTHASDPYYQVQDVQLQPYRLSREV